MDPPKKFDPPKFTLDDGELDLSHTLAISNRWWHLGITLMHLYAGCFHRAWLTSGWSDSTSSQQGPSRASSNFLSRVWLGLLLTPRHWKVLAFFWCSTRSKMWRYATTTKNIGSSTMILRTVQKSLSWSVISSDWPQDRSYGKTWHSTFSSIFDT